MTYKEKETQLPNSNSFKSSLTNQLLNKLLTSTQKEMRLDLMEELYLFIHLQQQIDPTNQVTTVVIMEVLLLSQLDYLLKSLMQIKLCSNQSDNKVRMAEMVIRL
jgi:hypothetical protein